MRTRVRKWGNSLGLRIPKAFAEELDLGEDSAVDLSISEGHLVVRSLDESYDLAALLEQVTADNLHGEIETGPAVGREEW